MRCSEVFRYAIITGRAENNPSAELSTALAKTQPKNFPFLATDADVVKKDRTYLIPLSRQFLVILKFLHPITGHGEYVFPNRNHPDKSMSNGVILHVIRRIGFANRATGHGFRHQFSSVLNENGFNKDWIEKQLNHEEGNVRGIYNHAQYLEGRREMMQWYADYIDGLTA